MNKRTKQFLKQEWLNLGIVGAVLMTSLAVLGPKAVMADAVTHPTPAEEKALQMKIAAMHNSAAPYGSLPHADNRPLPHSMTVVATAYSSEVSQTDQSPEITASGTHVRHGIIAANFLPLGTKVKFPKLYGDEVFVVEDRMNARYSKRLDIWMPSRGEAKQFGVRKVQIEIE